MLVLVSISTMSLEQNQRSHQNDHHQRQQRQLKNGVPEDGLVGWGSCGTSAADGNRGWMVLRCHDCEMPAVTVADVVFSYWGGRRAEDYSPNNSRKRFVWARLTGISVCFLSSMRIWYELLNQGTTSLMRLMFTR